MATEQNGDGSFTLNIGRVNGSVAIDTKIVQATVIRTVIDQNPVAIFGVSKPPDISLSPDNYPVLYSPPSHLSSPPGFGDNPSSAASKKVAARILLGLWWKLHFCPLY
nr:fasciclin-like arabinogalactan protein 4 [Ipomoea batatas]